MRLCRRCGAEIACKGKHRNDLWCSYCREKVNEELEGFANRPWAYYFSYYLRYLYFTYNPDKRGQI